MTGFTIDVLTIPETLDGPGGADFVEMTLVRNEIEAAVIGSHEISPTPADLLPRWQDPYSPQVLHVARVDGRIVGRAYVGLDAEEGSRHADVSIEVLEPFRRRGIGSALYDAAHGTAVDAGRAIIQGEFLCRPVDGEHIPSPTGFGSFPRDVEASRFALARGFELQQVVRASRLALPVDVGDKLAAAHVGDDYEVVAWQGSTPEEWLDDVATLHARMSTDAPSAGMEVSEEVWDADRVRTLDELRARADSELLIAAALHVPSGHLVAFSELSVPDQLELAVHQQDTLVLREHRGHHLGMLVKLANLAQLGERTPGHPSVVTWNAEENRHMLSVNEAIGFVPFGYEGAWKRVL